MLLSSAILLITNKKVRCTVRTYLPHTTNYISIQHRRIEYSKNKIRYQILSTSLPNLITNPFPSFTTLFSNTGSNNGSNSSSTFSNKNGLPNCIANSKCLIKSGSVKVFTVRFFPVTVQ